MTDVQALRDRLWADRRAPGALALARPYPRLFQEGGVRPFRLFEAFGEDPLVPVAEALAEVGAHVDPQDGVVLEAGGRRVAVTTFVGGLAEYEPAVFSGEFGLRVDGAPAVAVDGATVFAELVRVLPSPSEPSGEAPGRTDGIEVGTWARDPEEWPRYAGAPYWGVHAEAYDQEFLDRAVSAIRAAIRKAEAR